VSSHPSIAARNGSGAERAVDEALARGVLYGALSQCLRGPHGSARAALFAEEGRRALRAAAALLDDSASDDGLLPAVERWAALPAPAAAAFPEAHARLFGHALGQVSPFETDYGPEGAFSQPQELADIAGYYLAFGLRPLDGVDERVDHVACESEFMGFLCRKEAFVLASAGVDAEALDVVRGAARTFLRDHLGRFGRAVGRRLAVEDPKGLLGLAGEVLFRFLGLECVRHGVPAGPATLDLRPLVPDETPMACGDGAPCPLVPGPRRR
jgi:TorA maturation chaperone TorD